MKDILITDNNDEIVRLGKEIYKEKSSIYSDKMVALLMDTIEKNMPKASVAEKEYMLFHSIYDYWVYGNNIGEEFFYNFCNLTHEQKRSYISSKERLIYLEQLNKKDDAHILNNKYEAYQKFQNLYRREMVLLSGEEDYELFCDFVDRHHTFVIKPTDLGFSKGVRKETLPAGMDKKVYFKSLLAEGRAFKEEYEWGKETSVILEELIPQAESISKLHPASANAVRCTTIRIGDDVHIYYPWLKIGVNGDFATTASLGSLLAGINSATGIIDTVGTGEYGQREKNHPNTHIQIPGFVVPRWDELVDMAKELARSLPTISYVGWDFVLTEEGWCIMEGNYAGEFLWQLLYGKGMKKEFEELIGWELKRDFWWKK